MKILLTNDDGITAPGLRALHTALSGLGEVTVVAPATVQSATSHGVTFHTPLMASEVAMDDGSTGFSIDGRPADCVKIALASIWETLFGAGAKPDLTISGMNSGANVGVNIVYSGTVGAARESAFRGVPAIAVSLRMGGAGTVFWKRAAEIARIGIDRILEHPLDPHGVMNLNLPRITDADAPTPPLKVVAMNTAEGLCEYERRVSPDGRVYFWAAGDGMAFAHTGSDTDVEAVDDGFMTVTPLEFDLTDHARMQTWRERLCP